jgi:hypothetical protein
MSQLQLIFKLLQKSKAQQEIERGGGEGQGCSRFCGILLMASINYHLRLKLCHSMFNVSVELCLRISCWPYFLILPGHSQAPGLLFHNYNGLVWSFSGFWICLV